MITITQTVNVSLSIKKDEMKKGLVIERVGMNKLDNAQHVQLHSALYAIMAEFDLTKIGIPEEAKTEWDGSLHLEKDLNIETTASTTSKLLKKKDEARTRLALFIFSQVRSFLLSPETDEVEAAERLYVVTKGYAGIQQESQDRETAHIDGLVEDLKKTEHAADMTKLRLTSALTKLETLNKEFAELHLQRTKERAAKKLPATAKVRAEVDEHFERILDLLKSNYLFGKTPIEPTLIETLVGRFNQRMHESDAAYRQGQAIKKASADKKKKPDAPKNPKDPKDPKPKKPGKDDGKPDIHLPEGSDPKKPDAPKKPEGEGGGTGGGGAKPGGGSGTGGGEQPKKPKEGGGDSGNPDIHLPEE